MSVLRTRALVLSAGFGTRLRPLTATLPKPLLPVCGEPAVGYTLRQLSAAGCELACLNLHHLPEQIPEQLGTAYFGLSLRYRREPEILGTLGPLAALRDALQDADLVLLVNGDTVCRWPWKRMIRHHLKHRARATLLVHGRLDPEIYGGGVGIDGAGRVAQLRDDDPVAPVASRRIFMGAHVLDPSLLDRVTDGPGDIVADLYQPLLREGAAIHTVATSARWHDLGTPGRYHRGVLDVARGRWPRPLWRGTRRAPLSRIAPEARLERTVVERWARIGKGARLRRTLVLDGASVGAGSELHDCIVGPGVQLPVDTRLTGQMVCVAPPGHQPGERESLLGSLVFTPLDET